MRLTDKLKDGAVVVLFTSDGCGPCQGVKASLKNQISLYNGRHNFDAHLCQINKAYERDIFDEYGIQSVPQVVMLHNGEIIHHWKGTSITLEPMLKDFYKRVKEANDGNV